MNRWQLTVSSGTGPIEPRTFVHGLSERLLVALGERGIELEHVITYGEPSAPRSVDLILRAHSSCLLEWHGTHVLVERLRGRRARKRWFVTVRCERFVRREPVPIDAADVTFDTCRAGGAGGQHVNRTESAVRATHRPSGVAVRVESERSQHQNRREALSRLAEALARRAADQHASGLAARRHAALRVERGSPVMTWHVAHDGMLTFALARPGGGAVLE